MLAIKINKQTDKQTHTHIYMNVKHSFKSTGILRYMFTALTVSKGTFLYEIESSGRLGENKCL